MLEKVNVLPIGDLRALLRSNEKRPICWVCDEHLATDIHHRDSHHHNNDPANLVPTCKLCHDEIHGISAQLNDLGLVVRQFYTIQDQRKAMSNRLQAYHKLGYHATHAGSVFDEMVELESHIGDVVTTMVVKEPIYEAWLRQVEGVGPILSAAIIARIGSVDRFETISALWAYGGLHVVDGRAPKRRKNEVANWDAELRTLIAFKVPKQFIKATSSFGRELYDQYKAFYESVHDARCPVWSHPEVTVNKAGTKATVDGKGCSRKGHIDNMAMRKVGKVFLANLWVAWRDLLGLSVTEPYAAKLDGHSHIIQPWDWVTGGEDTYRLRIELAKQEQLELM